MLARASTNKAGVNVHWCWNDKVVKKITQVERVVSTYTSAPYGSGSVVTGVVNIVTHLERVANTVHMGSSRSGIVNRVTHLERVVTQWRSEL
jgi:hypothetical protein